MKLSSFIFPKMNKKAIPFQPDAMEIRCSRLPFLLRYCGFWVALLFLLAIGWACIGKTDKIVQSQGKLVSDQQDIMMKPIETAVLKSIEVQVGDVVKKDQILVTFDPEVRHKELERLENDLDMLESQFARLYAEFQGNPYLPKDTESGHWQNGIYKQRQSYYNERLIYFEQEIKRIESMHKSAKESLDKQQERLTAVRRIEEMFVELRKSNAVSLKELLETTMSRMEIETGVTQLQNSLSEYEHEKMSTIASRNAFIEEWRNSVSEKMVECQRELISTQKVYDQSKRQASYTQLRAPCDAVVHEIAQAATVGSAVGEAEALLTLVPLNGTLEVEAEVLPQDIGEIKVGGLARIKFTAFPFQKHGTMDGEVISISENTFSRQSEMPGMSSSFYRVRLKISGQLKHVKEHFRLIPGMETQVELNVGKRRIIEYILYPLIKGLDEAGREP